MVDLQGHRGARGLMPENSIAGFRLALEIGVTTLEMDAVISADERVVVSHEPWFNRTICIKPDGSAIPFRRERAHNIFRMPYAVVEQYDCGSRRHPDFPEQERRPASKPLLTAVIESAERFADELDRAAPRYNVEIKSSPKHDGVYHPPPERYARLVYGVLESRGVLERSTIQSFDARALRAVREIEPAVRLSLLVDNRRGFSNNLRMLPFLPEVYSPARRLVRPHLIEQATSAGVEVLPWTVNDPSEMRRFLEMGVVGIITDYPDLGREVVEAFLRERMGLTA